MKIIHSEFLQSSLSRIYSEHIIRIWQINLCVVHKYREENEDRIVEVTNDNLNLLHNVNYLSKMKGKLLFMLKLGKEFGFIHKK